jgi:phosphatidylinositol alpha-1,6-mannosyltransferase
MAIEIDRADRAGASVLEGPEPAAPDGLPPRGQARGTPPFLLISDVFPPKIGGSGRWFFEIYRRMPRELVRIAAGEDPRQEQFDLTHDLPLTRLPLSPPVWGVLNWGGLKGYCRAVARLRRLVRAEGIRQVHCGRSLPEGLMALALKVGLGTRYLCYVHGEELGLAHQSRELGWLMRRVYRKADAVIANSRNTERMLLEEWALPPEKVRVLHPGVDTERFVPAAPDPEFRRAVGWEGRTVVLTVGRLQKRKGHDVMIQALPALRRAVPDILYAIAGDGEEREALRQLVAVQGVGDCVQFLGEPDDRQLIRCYQQCDLFVLPNRAVGKDIEGFGMVLLEAQACGKAVVAGASGGTAETMSIPQTGRVVSCDGPAGLEALLPELLRDRVMLARMGAAGREWVAENFDWKALGHKALRIATNGGGCQE